MASRGNEDTPQTKWWKNRVGFPCSVEQAQQHITHIREEKKADDPDDNALTVHANLTRTSTGLNSEPTHFLLELLQNADDAKYDAPITPTMVVTFTQGNSECPSLLRFDVNEKGFASDNVESICRLARSSKPCDNTGDVDHIGEKGVGFKSVFGVADAVWISSGYYSFQFINSESEILGMLAPRWSFLPYAESPLPGQTTILLQLSSQFDVKLLVSKLKSFDPRLLLFLRQLKQIKITVKEVDRRPWNIRLYRRHDVPTQDGMHSFAVERGNELISYLVYRYKVSGEEISFHKLRADRKVSHIMLAFPDNTSPNDRNLPPQDVYAFLPVRNYGLKFILQADFVLLDSRESINQSEWNDALIKKVPHIFLRAVQEFNRRGSRYMWLPYVPLGPYHDVILHDMPARTIELLSNEAVLESNEEFLARPSELTFVPVEFRADNGQPLIPPGSSKTKYLSDNYADQSTNILTLLKVPVLSENGFLSDLEAFITNNPAVFQGQEPRWHSQVACILSGMLSRDDRVGTNRKIIESLKLIPISGSAAKSTAMKDSTWIASNDGAIFFSSPPGHQLQLPRALNANEVHGDITKRRPQWNLFIQLGVTEFSERTICARIIDTHMDDNFQPEKVDLQDLISHVLFLRQSRWEAPANSSVDLWVGTSDEFRLPGSAVYVDTPDDEKDLPYNATVVFKDHPDEVHFLHKQYKAAMESDGDDDWLVWLSVNLGLTVLPRIARAIDLSSGDWTLTHEFQILINNDPLVVLQILRHWWRSYERWIVDTDNSYDRPNEASRKRIRATVSLMKVPCRNRGTAPLCQTLLPRRGVILAMEIEPLSEGAPSAPGIALAETSQDLVLNTVSNIASNDLSNNEFVKAHEAKELPSSSGNVAATAGKVNDNLAATPGVPSITLVSASKKSICSRLSSLKNIFKRHEKEVAIVDSERENTPPRDAPAPLSVTKQHYRPLLNREWPTASQAMFETRSLEEEDQALSSPQVEISKKPNSELLLCISNPEDESWDFLANLGVIVSTNVDVFLARLQQLRQTPATKSHVLALYDQIQHSAVMKDYKRIRDAFAAQDLVFLPDTIDNDESAGEWTGLASCVWSGPDCLERTPRLDQFYISLETLFITILGCQEAKLIDLAKEAQGLGESDSLKRIEDVFNTLCEYIEQENSGLEGKERNTAVAQLQLQYWQIFPTRCGLGADGPHKLQTALDSDEWYIPDNLALAGLFGNDLHFFTIRSTARDDLNQLYKLLGIQNRLISLVAQPTGEPVGNDGSSHSYEDWIKKRMPYVTGLIPRSAQDRETIISRLMRVRVFRAEKVVTTWTVKHTSGRGSQATEDGQVLMVDVVDSIYFYIATMGSEETRDLTEIATKLVHVCRITDSNHSELLRDILLEPSRTRIEQNLRMKGILFKPANPKNILNDDCLPTKDTTPNYAKSPPNSESKSSFNSAEKLSLDSGDQTTTPTSETVSKPGGISGARKENADANKDMAGRQQLDYVSEQGLANGDNFSQSQVPTGGVAHGGAVTGTAPLLEPIQDSEINKEKGTSNAHAESLSRGRTLSPHPQMSRSTSRTPSTHYIESGDHERSNPLPQSKKENWMNMDRGWMTVTPPMTIFYGDDTKDTKYFGEIYVSRYLETFLSDDVYKPKEYWTSPLRSRNGLPQYTEERFDTSTFTIKKTRGKLRDAIIDRGQIPSDALADCVTVHIELKRMHLQGKNNEDVYILARVYRVWDNPGIAMYADPWQLQLEGFITLETVSNYKGNIGKSVRTVFAEEFASVATTDETSKIYDGLPVGPGQIRLLKLQHVDDDSEPLKGSLEIAEVDKLKKFNGFWAISYVWGHRPDGPNPSTFTTEKGTIPITESLSSCLKCLRHKRVHARIWADALCINQRDNVEKSIQVRRLAPRLSVSRIFINHSARRTATAIRVGGQPAANPKAPGKDDKVWVGINKFLERSWFTRAWIIQELALGGDVSIMSGRSEMKWDCFMESLLECERHLNRNLDPKQGAFLESSAAAIALHRTRQIYHHATKKFKFLQLLEMFAYSESSRPRDKMFSLLNLAVDSFLSQNIFDPDYVSTNEMVITNYARGFVQNGVVLELLYHAGHGKSTSFCSWIPDFMSLRFERQYYSTRQRTYPPTISTWKTRGGKDGFYAGLHALPHAKVRDNHPQSAAIHPILAIRGYIIDEVHKCSELGLGHSSGRITFAKALQNMHHYISFLEYYPDIDGEDATVEYNGEGLGMGAKWQDKLLLQLLVGDSKGPQTGLSLAAPFFHREEDDVKPWPAETGPEILSLVLDQDAHEYGKKPVEAQAQIIQYWQTAWAFTSRIPGAAFCTTRNPRAPNKPYAGIVPGEAKPGDFIFIANGGKVPFVLRMVDDKLPCYMLIGECYIHGIMYGAPPGIQEEADKEIYII